MKRAYVVFLALLSISCSQVERGEGGQTAGVVSSKTLMQSGPTRCITQVEGQTSTLYTEGSKMRMDTMPSDAHAIYTEDMMYAWSGKQGSMMKLSDLKKLSDMAGQKVRYKEEVIAESELAGTSCERVSIPAGTFTPPVDVQFFDIGEMLKQQMGAGLN